MPNCHVCKQPLSDDSRFCGQCGASVDALIPVTQIVQPSSKRLNKILILLIALLIVALVAVSFLKTGAIPTPWTPPPASTVQPVLRSPSLPYTLSCNCETPDFTLTIKKIVVIPEAAGQVLVISLQGMRKSVKVFLGLYLQDLSRPSPPSLAFVDFTDYNYNCPTSLDQGKTIVKAVLFSSVPPAHAQYRLTPRVGVCGEASTSINSPDLVRYDFKPVTFTFS